MGKRLVRDPRFNTAKSKKQYVNSWTSHIAELTYVLAESNIPSTEWDNIFRPLRNAVTTAANKLEADGVWE